MKLNYVMHEMQEWCRI